MTYGIIHRKYQVKEGEVTTSCKREGSGKQRWVYKQRCEREGSGKQQWVPYIIKDAKILIDSGMYAREHERDSW